MSPEETALYASILDGVVFESNMDVSKINGPIMQFTNWRYQVNNLNI